MASAPRRRETSRGSSWRPACSTAPGALGHTVSTCAASSMSGSRPASLRTGSSRRTRLAALWTGRGRSARIRRWRAARGAVASSTQRISTASTGSAGGLIPARGKTQMPKGRKTPPGRASTLTHRGSPIAVELPDLEANVQADIVKDNVLAMSALYFAAQLEELKFFSTADKVAEQFHSAVIPISRGRGGRAIQRYIRQATTRLNETERRSIYARAFGFAQGSVDEPMPNREFADLWIHFLSAVCGLSREQDATTRKAITVHKNARELAVNLSLHGSGIAHLAAVELKRTIKSVIKMMSYPKVLSAYGAKDVWQLVERVSELYLGGAVNSVQQRTL